MNAAIRPYTLAERWLQDLDRYQQQHQEERPDE